MSSVSFRIISSGASNSIVCSIFLFFFLFNFCFLFFCSSLALVLYVVCRCCNKVSFKKKKDIHPLEMLPLFLARLERISYQHSPNSVLCVQHTYPYRHGRKKAFYSVRSPTHS